MTVACQTSVPRVSGWNFAYQAPVCGPLPTQSPQSQLCCAGGSLRVIITTSFADLAHKVFTMIVVVVFLSSAAVSADTTISAARTATVAAPCSSEFSLPLSPYQDEPPVAPGEARSTIAEAKAGSSTASLSAPDGTRQSGPRQMQIFEKTTSGRTITLHVHCWRARHSRLCCYADSRKGRRAAKVITFHFRGQTVGP